MSTIGDALVRPAALDNRGAFGISVTGNGKAGSLAVFGFSWRGTARGAMLSSQNFVDAGMAQSGNTVFTGIPVGPADSMPGAFFTPEIAVANFGFQPVKATVLFARTDASGPTAANVATVTVPAMTSQTITLPPLTGDPGLRNSFIVQSDAAPGTFFSSVVSVGSSGFDLVEQIGKDQRIQENGGGHPWALTDDAQDAVLLLFNHSAVAEYFNVKIGNGKALWQNAWQLAPMETRAISIRELIAGQVKDQDGVALPKALDQGEISWFTPKPAEGKGRLLQVDRASQLVAGNTRIARNFSCGYNIVLCGVLLSQGTINFPFQTDSSTLALGPLIPLLCLAYDPHACYGQSYGQGGSGYSYRWQSNIPSIATVSGSSTSSTATFWGAGVGSGSATGFINSAYCGPSGGGTPNVAKLSCSPASVTRGASVTCSVTGAPAGYSINWSFAGMGGAGAVTGPSGAATTWSGVMVQSGTVTAKLVGISPLTLTQDVTVNNRSGWASASVTATSGTVPGCSFTSPPPNSSATLGCSNWSVPSFDLSPPTSVQSGPNTNYSYYTSNISLTQSFLWQIHPDVSNLQSDFSLHQVGGVPVFVGPADPEQRHLA